eukprot:6467425-Amphidinium_carterae.1
MSLRVQVCALCPFSLHQAAPESPGSLKYGSIFQDPRADAATPSDTQNHFRQIDSRTGFRIMLCSKF